MKIGKIIFYKFYKFLFKYYCPLSITGNTEALSHSRTLDKSFIVCTNHSSHIDACVILAAVSRIYNIPESKIYMLAADDYFFDNTIRACIFQGILNLIPITRNNEKIYSLRKTIKYCQKVVNSKGVIVIYPEGTRTKYNSPRKFKPGAAWISNKLGVDILPAYIFGTDRVMPKGTIIPRPYNIGINFGEINSYHNINKLQQDIVKLGEIYQT